jgi:4-hydroxy-3-methylbut-2-enyl diphosphate reductase
MGQVPEGTMTLIETPEDAENVSIPEGSFPAFATQTTLSVDDTAEVISVLKRRFPDIRGPRGEDICYATTNRQQAVKVIADGADMVLVVGASNSSNSRRLVEVALKAGAKDAMLIASAKDIDHARLAGAGIIGLSAGASAPEVLVQDVIQTLKDTYGASVEEVETVSEDISFNLPAALRD